MTKEAKATSTGYSRPTWSSWLLSITFIFVYLPKCTPEISEGTYEYKQKMTDNIDLRLAGGDPADFFSTAVLTCSAKWMAFVITMAKDDFAGVMYARGTYHLKKGPCFMTAENEKGKQDLVLKMPIEDCGIEFDKELGGYTTTVVVQADPELIFPGDVAFNLLCADASSKKSKFKGMRSFISLVPADPAASSSELDGALSAMSPNDVVTLTPPKLPSPKSKKEEL